MSTMQPVVAMILGKQLLPDRDDARGEDGGVKWWWSGRTIAETAVGASVEAMGVVDVLRSAP